MEQVARVRLGSRLLFDTICRADADKHPILSKVRDHSFVSGLEKEFGLLASPSNVSSAC